MTSHRLPGRIAAIMLGTIAALVLTTALSILWMTRALDQESRDSSTSLVKTAFGNLAAQSLAMVLDYGKWDDLVENLDPIDVDQVFEDVGVSAVLGEAFQVAIVWGPGIDGDVGWIDDRMQQGVSGLLGSDEIALADARLRSVPIGAYEGVTFYSWRGGELFSLAATRVEPTEAADGREVPDAGISRLIVGARIDDPTLREVEGAVLLEGLSLAHRRPADRMSIPLMGGDGEPIAYVSWETPMAGTLMLRKMLPFLLVVMTLATGLVLVGATLTRRSAGHLVRAEQNASVAARTDGLTGLPNRFAFSEALATPAPAGCRAILFLDLNGFKRINDSIGHAAGDQVIAAMAARLMALCDPDTLLARIGGDEFVFIVAGLDAQFHVERLARAVERSMEAPVAVMGHQLRLGAAMGYAVQPSDATSGADLVRQADLAMYEAKRQPGGPVAFGAMIDRADRDARAIEVALREALDRPGELSIAYQPIADMGTGRLTRAEALARWTSPRFGVVGPDRFIAVAEQSGLMVELGRQLMGLVCDDLVAHPDLEVSVNVSPLQLMAPGFVPDLVTELARRGIAPSRIEIELTERVVVDDPGLAATRLAELHAAGFSTALDDFGTGYSSIGYLNQMSFDTVKIDRSFVSGLCASGERLAMVNAMIQLCHAMRLRVVCEGVETADEMAMLRELGCDLAQGYHLDRPLPIGRLIEGWGGPAQASRDTGVAPQAAVA